MHRIARILKRVEAGCDVEAVVRERQRFNLADTNIGAGAALLRNINQCRCGINSANLSAMRLRDGTGKASPATDIKDRRAFAELDGGECRFV